MEEKNSWAVLTDLNNETRNVVIKYMNENKMSLYRFAKECKVGQPNLHVFLNGKTLAGHNLERIWKYFETVRYK